MASVQTCSLSFEACLVSDCCGGMNEVQVGDWTACSEACGTGLKNRTVSCAERDGTVVNSSYCVGLEPQHQAYCNDYPCDFCSTTDCSNKVPWLIAKFAVSHIKHNSLQATAAVTMKPCKVLCFDVIPGNDCV